jgi:hypothetical protein
MSRPTVLRTVPAVIDALGGKPAVQRMFRPPPSPETINNWHRWRKFPANVYDAMIKALNSKEIDAPPSLWGQKPTRKGWDDASRTR